MGGCGVMAEYPTLHENNLVKISPRRTAGTAARSSAAA
jgi:hypothetical protein